MWHWECTHTHLPSFQSHPQSDPSCLLETCSQPQLIPERSLTWQDVLNCGKVLFAFSHQPPWELFYRNIIIVPRAGPRKNWEVKEVSIWLLRTSLGLLPPADCQLCPALHLSIKNYPVCLRPPQGPALSFKDASGFYQEESPRSQNLNPQIMSILKDYFKQ